MSDETKARVIYKGGDERVTRITINGRKYDYDQSNKDGILMPLGDATALVTGEPAAWEFKSEARQAEVMEDNYPVQAESVDTPTIKNDEGGRAVSENANPNPSGFRKKS